ncbi:hypothetical protein SAMN02745126_01740 [Enhydrobacter aerosaccus]|uniref:Uncharacterized protein n=1 Tax=Enhydrobacter aerosaccus TaxID=225324 RepID=A0A1T4LVK6_9HYPH|nr:hypothetical protein [Enhydrobacter aerosaccus]SJZ58666.1 hypothetical protein SAMN02745126_01740 [Enhydrobacter aerosaccus]
MTIDDAPPRIACPIDIFDAVEEEIRRLSMAINRAPSSDKRELANQLLEQVSRLLECDAYDPGNENCRLCRGISTLRRKTATLIETAAALG